MLTVCICEGELGVRGGEELASACLRSQPTWMDDHREELAQVSVHLSHDPR
jgi:hypothetical protein